jgi:hypothetical protein
VSAYLASSLCAKCLLWNIEQTPRPERALGPFAEQLPLEVAMKKPGGWILSSTGILKREITHSESCLLLCSEGSRCKHHRLPSAAHHNNLTTISGMKLKERRHGSRAMTISNLAKVDASHNAAPIFGCGCQVQARTVIDISQFREIGGHVLPAVFYWQITSTPSHSYRERVRCHEIVNNGSSLKNHVRLQSRHTVPSRN